MVYVRCFCRREELTALLDKEIHWRSDFSIHSELNNLVL